MNTNEQNNSLERRTSLSECCIKSAIDSMTLYK